MISSKLIEITQKAIYQSSRRNNHQDGDSVNLCYDLMNQITIFSNRNWRIKNL